MGEPTDGGGVMGILGKLGMDTTAPALINHPIVKKPSDETANPSLGFLV